MEHHSTNAWSGQKQPRPLTKMLLLASFFPFGYLTVQQAQTNVALADKALIVEDQMVNASTMTIDYNLLTSLYQKNAAPKN